MLQQDEVFGDLFQDNKRKKKKKSTDLLMTLNLNEKFSTMTSERKKQFKDFAVSMFDNKKILEFFKDRTSPENPLAHMDHIEIKWAPEVGKETGRLHLHALVAIQHHGFLTFKANDFCAYAKDYFGHSVYVDCPVSSNEKINWENYLQKVFREINK